MQTASVAVVRPANRALANVVQSYGVGLIVGLIGVVILFHDMAGKSLATTLWGNDLHPHIIVWTAEWVYRTVFERLAPLDVWNANSYFPYAKSLAFSDSLFSAQLIYAPLRLLGVGTPAALYYTSAGFCILGAVLSDRLLQSYEYKAGERALIVAAAHFSLPMTAFLIPHFQLFGMQLVPPLLLALHRVLSRWQGRDLVLVTVLFCLAGGYATYVVPMAGLVAALMLLAFSLPILRRVGVGEIIHGLGWKGPAVTIALLGLFFVIQLRPYLSLFAQLPPQPMTETFIYSARPWSVLLHPSGNSFWYNPPPMNYGYWERVAFPGVPLLVLAAIGVLALVRRRPLYQLEEPVIPLTTYAVVLFVVCWVLSWGPYLQLCSTCDDKIRLPFLALAKFIPGVANIRAPGRYAQFYGLPLGLLAVESVRWLMPRLRFATSATAASAAAACLAALVLIDQMPKAPTYPFAIGHADFFRAAKPVIGEGTPIIQLPITGADHLGTWSNRVRQVESSTIHWAKLVTGAGSRDTPEQNELITLDAQLRAGHGSLGDVASFARRLGIRKFVLFPGDYPAEVQARILDQVRGLDAETLLENSEGIVLSLRPVDGRVSN